MIPFLTYPLALLGLAAVPALAAIYLLRNRFRRRPVSSLVLWRFHARPASSGPKLRRLQLPLLFFLELLALLLLVAAAAGPHWSRFQSSRPLIVVLDDSLSMRAIRDGASARARARDYLEALVRGQRPPSTRLILAGVAPRSLGPAAKDWAAVGSLLPLWKCGSPSAAIDSALTLAAEVGQQQANILVLTDHPPAGTAISNPRLEWHAFGWPLDNAAIINASRTASGAQDRCLIEVANFSSGPLSAPLLVQAGSNAAQPAMISLAPRETRRLVFNIPSAAPSLQAALGADALAEDNDALLLPPIRNRVRVRVALTNASNAALANRALDATGLRAAVSDDPQLVIHETDGGAGSNAWTLCWAGSAATNARTGPFLVDSSHPLAQGLALEGVVWAADPAPPSPSGVPVILAGDTPLLSVREDAIGRRHLTLNFNPDRSTLHQTPNWPVLFWNLLTWRIAEMPGLKDSNARLGAEVILKTAGGSVEVIQPGGARQSFPGTGGEIALETPEPGVYSVVMEHSTNRFSVNALAAEESDLSACATGQWGQWSEGGGRQSEDTPAVWICGLLALALLTTHLYVVSGAKGGG
jgi:hypothetical protein